MGGLTVSRFSLVTRTLYYFDAIKPRFVRSSIVQFSNCSPCVDSIHMRSPGGLVHRRVVQAHDVPPPPRADRQAEETSSESSESASDEKMAPASAQTPETSERPTPSTARRRGAGPLMSNPLAVAALLLALLGLASVALVGGLQIVAKARSIAPAGLLSRPGAEAAAAAEAMARARGPQRQQQQQQQPQQRQRPTHVTVAIADLHGDWAHGVIALRASGVLSKTGAEALPTPREAERDWRLPSNHTLPLSSTGGGGGGGDGGEGGSALFDLSSLGAHGRLHLVQTGDLLDRGRHGLALVRLFGALKDAAAREGAAGGGKRGEGGGGGRPDSAPRASVALLMGNHEMLNLQGEAERYAHAAELRAVAEADAAAAGSGARAWARLMAPGGDLGDALRGDRAVAHVAGEGPCRALYVHAGLTPGLLVDLVSKAGGGAEDAGGGGDDDDDASQPPAVRAINRAAAAALRECSGGGGGGGSEAGCPRDIGARHPIGPLLLGGQGPVWTRALAPDGRGGSYRSNGQLALVCAAVDDVLRRIGGDGGGGDGGGGGGGGGGGERAAAPRRIVVGHTITRTDGSPTIACGGRLVFLDVGMSRAMWEEDASAAAWEGGAAASSGDGGGGGNLSSFLSSPPFGGPAPALALRCEYDGAGRPGAAELVFARPKRGHEKDDPRTAPLEVRRMPLPALGAVPRQGVAAG